MKNDLVKKVSTFVIDVMYKYSIRKNNFEPLSKLLGKYWDDMFLRAVRNVLFERVPIPKNIGAVTKKPAYTWRIKRHFDCPMEHNYVEWVAKKIINEEMSLRKMVWMAKGWGDPYKSEHQKFFFITGEGFGFANKNEFFDMYWNKLEYFVPNEEKRIELMVAIFNAADERFQDGLRVGARSYRDKMNRDHIDKMVDIYNNFELGLNDLKKIIDE